MKKYWPQNISILIVSLLVLSSAIMIKVYLVKDYSSFEEPSLNLQEENSIDIAKPASQPYPIYNCQEIGQWDINVGKAMDVAVKDDYVFVCSGHGGLKVFNLTDPDNPSLVYTYETRYYANDIAIQGDYAFVAFHKNGTIIFDITDPAAPIKIGEYVTGDSYRAVTVQDGYAFVVSMESELEILDISDLENPTLVSQFQEGVSTFEVSVYEETVFLGRAGNFALINISDINDPEKISEETTSGIVYDLVFEDDIAYCAVGVEGVQLYDVSDKLNPLFLTFYPVPSVPIPASAFSITKKGNMLYVSAGSYGLIVLEVINPTYVTYVNEFLTGTCASTVNNNFLYEDKVYLAASNYGLSVLFEEDLSEMVHVYFGGTAKGIAVEGDLAYLANGENALQVLNISDPSNPERVGYTFSNLGLAEDICIYGQTCFVADNGGCMFQSYNLRIYDITNPINPSYVNTIPFASEITRVRVFGKLLFVCASTGGLSIYGLNNPSTPLAISSFHDGGDARGIFVNDSYAFLADGYDGLEILDITDIYNPFEVNQFNDGGFCMDTWVSGKFVITADSTSGVEIFDAADVTNLIKLDEIYDALSDVSSARSLYIEEDLIYVADSLDGLEIIDWSDPQNLDEVAQYYDNFDIASDVFVREGTAFVPDELDGLEIIIHDSDRDFLTDYLEEFFGTDPDDPDSDDDGMDDKFEVDNDLDPLDETDATEDPDDDGLTNLEEFNNNTKPNDNDSDDDGLTDGDEILNYATDPLDVDSDDDHLSDYAEVHEHQTDPNDMDSDDDNLTDYEEVHSGQDSYITDPNDPDTDDDGLNDKEEAVAGLDGYVTNPTDEDSDDDGYTDGEEADQGSNPLDPDDPGTPPPDPTETGTETDRTTGSGSICGTAVILLTFSLISFRMRINNKKRK